MCMDGQLFQPGTLQYDITLHTQTKTKLAAVRIRQMFSHEDLVYDQETLLLALVEHQKYHQSLFPQ